MLGDRVPQRPTIRLQEVPACSVDEFLDEWCAQPKPLLQTVAPTVALPLVTTVFRPFSQDVERAAIHGIACELLKTGPFSFLDLTPFEGNGVYAIYYQGDIEEYKPLRSVASTCPVYIGSSCTEENNGLYTRLKTHLRTIQH